MRSTKDFHPEALFATNVTQKKYGKYWKMEPNINIASFVIFTPEQNQPKPLQHQQIQQEHAKTTAQAKSPIWADQSVDFGALHVVELLHSFLDLGFGGLDVHQEHQRVDLLNLLHGGLRSHRALDDPILVQLVPSRFHGLSRVLGIPSLCQGLGLVEANLGADLLHLHSCGQGPKLKGSQRDTAMQCYHGHHNNAFPSLKFAHIPGIQWNCCICCFLCLVFNQHRFYIQHLITRQYALHRCMI